MSEEEQIILPDGFKRVEYLQSTGNEVIYTGIIPTDKHGFYAEIESLGGTGYACGTQTVGGKPGFWIYINNGVLQASYENNSKTTVSSKAKTIIKNNFLNDRKLASDISIVKNYSQDFIYNWSYEFTLFKSTYGGNTKFDLTVPIRIYRFKISENEKIIRDFVPCLDINDTPCMYDILGTGTIEENTYYNQGTGKFLTKKDFEWNYPFINNNYNLPAGFKKCVYLQSDGTQWIDTGVVPNNEIGLFCKTIKLDNSNTSMFGVRENTSSAIMTPYVAGKTISYRWKAEGKDNIYTLDKAGDYIFSSFLNFYNDRLAKIDSEDTDWITSLAGILENYTQNIWLFSTNFQGTFNDPYGKYVGRVYRAQITQGFNLIHDYVPCLDADNRPCMYDLIEQEALYNQSGGTEFTYCVEHQLPSDFIKLKYLESNGTQYIKTGHVPTNTTGLYIDTQDVGSGDTIPMGSWNSTSTNTRFFITRQTTSHSAGYGWGAWTSVSTTKGSVRYDSTLNWLNDRKSITNNPLFVTVIKNLGELPFTPQYDIWMFGVNHAESHAYKFNGRIYRAKISEGSEIVRDFVPAWDDSKQKTCMYDLINNVAYYNDGEGEFLTNRDYEGTYKGYTGLGCIGNRLGSDYDPINEKLPSGYTRVEFLESTGTQYIKTEIDPRHLSYKIVFDGFNGSGSGLQLFGVEKYTTPNYYWYGTITQNNNNGIGFKTIVPAEEEGNFWINANDNPIGSRGISEVNFNENYVYIKGAKEENKKTCGDYTERILASHTSCALFANQNGVNKCKARVYSLQGNYHGIEAMNFIPAIDSDGKPCMYDSVRKRTFYKAGGDEFIVGLKTLSNALQLRLPMNGGTITLSLPTNDNIEYYEEKIRANNPNWTITFQYH